MTAWVPLITPVTLADRLAASPLSVVPEDAVSPEDCADAIEVAVSLVRAFTRGRGLRTSIPAEGDTTLAQGLRLFVLDVAPEVGAVVALVAARLASNPSQESYRSITEEGVGASTRGSFQGLTLHEMTVLAPWRRRLGVA